MIMNSAANLLIRQNGGNRLILDCLVFDFSSQLPYALLELDITYVFPYAE